jgi:hypothetical protein
MNEDKTKFTLEHAQRLYQTLADILGEKYNIKIIANVEKKR